jgi:hypothetical protein
MTCKAVTAPSGDACGKPATIRIRFVDGDVVLTCQMCATNMSELARSHGTIVKVEKLDGK